jgi:hypothetical protein
LVFQSFDFEPLPDEGYSRNVPDVGYSRNVPDEGYSRNVPDEGYYTVKSLVFTIF